MLSASTSACVTRGRKKGRGGKRPTTRQDPTQLDTPSDSPKRKDSKLEFHGRLSHASPRVTDSLITQFFLPESSVENAGVAVKVRATTPSPTSKLSASPPNNNNNISPVRQEIPIPVEDVFAIQEDIFIKQDLTNGLEQEILAIPAPAIAIAPAPAPEVITLSDDEGDEKIPRTATPHKMIYEPPNPIPNPNTKLSPTSALSQLNLANGAVKKGVKSRRRLNPNQTQNQMAPAVTKLGLCNKPKAPTTNTATQVNSERPQVNHKLTEYFPVRRSERKTKKTVLEERQRSIEEAVLAGREDGLEVHNFEGKGRGVVTTRPFQRGEFVVEYAGELIKMDEAREREKLYAQDQNTGCYMYYFKHRNYQYCVDATAESDRLGRLVNHSRNGNLMTKTILLNNCPRLVLVAKEDIPPGEEVTYDYGDRSKESLRYHPWLAN